MPAHGNVLELIARSRKKHINQEITVRRSSFKENEVMKHVTQWREFLAVIVTVTASLTTEQNLINRKEETLHFSYHSTVTSNLTSLIKCS